MDRLHRRSWIRIYISQKATRDSAHRDVTVVVFNRMNHQNRQHKRNLQ